MKALLIVASGKSTRFGGFPKAFCQIGEGRNIDNILHYASSYFDKIFLVVNNHTYEKYQNTVNGCEMFKIITGQGDAHSLLKSLLYIHSKYESLKDIYICWGDTFFVSSKPFMQFLNKITKVDVGAVACSYDEKPYAWFETDDKMKIITSHFAKTEGTIPLGLHDQSLFHFNMDYILQYLDEYRKSLNIPFDNDENYDENHEMKLLYFFEYMYVKQKPIKAILIDSKNVFSFNTQEELNHLINLKKWKGDV